VAKRGTRRSEQLIGAAQLEDMILLARHFLHTFSRQHQRPGIHLTAEDEIALKEYQWPGNVRELKNVMERAVLLSTGDRLELNLQNDLMSEGNHPFSDNPSLDEVQRRYITHVLKKTGNKISGLGGAAEVLGMNRATLYSRIKKLGMR
jgi:DNA-binding NtrC family response regulator